MFACVLVSVFFLCYVCASLYVHVFSAACVIVCGRVLWLCVLGRCVMVFKCVVCDCACVLRLRAGVCVWSCLCVGLCLRLRLCVAFVTACLCVLVFVVVVASAVVYVFARFVCAFVFV